MSTAILTIALLRAETERAALPILKAALATAREARLTHRHEHKYVDVEGTERTS